MFIGCEYSAIKVQACYREYDGCYSSVDCTLRLKKKNLLLYQQGVKSSDSQLMAEKNDYNH